MKLLLKKTRIFWIYDVIISILLALCYFANKNSDRGVLLAWVIFIEYPIQLFGLFMAGPFFAIKIQKQNLTAKEFFWSVALIFTMTFFTYCIPIIVFRHCQGFLQALEVASIVSITYCITSFICKKVKK